MTLAETLGATTEDMIEATEQEIAMLKREIATAYKYESTSRSTMLHLATCMRQLEKAQEYRLQLLKIRTPLGV